MDIRGVVLLACILAFERGANANVVGARRAFVQELAKDVMRSKEKRVLRSRFYGRIGQILINQDLARSFQSTQSAGRVAR